ERDSLAGMVEQGILLLAPWGRPDRTQVRKEWQMDGIAVPVLGFSDAEYDAHGLIIDLKTTHALPNAIRTAHARQVASYVGVRSERDSLAGMVEQGILLLAPWGRPDRTQVRKEWQMDGIAVPVLGFSDAEYDAHGLIIDLKTTHALPNAIRTAHARQVASYVGV